MRLVVGCPVRNRAWILPRWFECLRAQTVHPCGFVFAHGPSEDDTIHQLAAGMLAGWAKPTHSKLLEDGRAHDRSDPRRYRTLVDLRNQLMAAARSLDADAYLSLDSDVLLEDPRTVEGLLAQLGGWDTAAPVLVLHPDPEAGAWNAGWWCSPNGDLRDPRRAWFRKDRGDIRWGEVEKVDIPMAAVLMGKRVLENCAYEWHESGEDLGFAQDLARVGANSAWATGIKARHVWEPAAL